MSEFYKKFLLEDVPRVTPGSNKQVFLGAFGKHPGWDDHVEDLGLETGSLNTAKVLFYVEGIGGEIDAGAWEKLDESQRLSAFKHIFVWHRPGQLLIGRLWSSSDGKGRTRYPMVVCAHCTGVTLAWALDHVLPRLEQVEQACVATQSAADVRSILGRFRAELRNLVSAQTTDLSPPNLDTAFLTRFAARPELGPQQEGWMRILYALQSQFGSYARGKFSSKSVSDTIRPQQLRVPRAADSISKAILQWCNFFLTQVDPQAPLLFTVPLEEAWLDVTAGQPTSQEVFCLRASPKSMPMASEVPYNLTPEFREQVRGVLAALEAGKPPASILTAAATSTTSAGQPAPKSKFLKWFGAGVLVALLAVAGIWIAKSQKPVGPPGASASANAGTLVTETPASDVSAAQPPVEPVAPTPDPPVVAPVPTVEPVATQLEAEAKRLAEEKRVADEKAKAEAAARLKAIAEEQEKVRLAAEAEAKRLAEQKRMAEEKAKAAAPVTDLARVNPDAKTTTPVAPVTPASDRPASSGRTERTNLNGMVFVSIPAGYWVGKYEVSQAEYEKVMKRNPSAYKGASHPVETVSYEDAMEFCRKLTALESSTGRLQKGWEYTLPTEAQWAEFAQGAELDHAVTSFQRSRRSNPEAVGTLAANPAGLHDVRGNVWEWCRGTNDQKVLRGGSYEGFTATGLAPTLSLQYRWTLQPDQRKPQAGFRVVLHKQP
jgi:formylglycine-generating enzyme required for sulfatase activity